MKVSTDSRLLTAFAAQFGYSNVLDIGCGIGTISLLLAKYRSSSFVTAIDMDIEAVEVTRFNIENNGLENLVAFRVDAIFIRI
ncbi:MAG: methyltransferase [Saprospiraceae bacterium]